MGQSTGSTTSSAYLPGPQKQLANNFLGSQSMQKIMQAIPAGSDQKSRIAGQALTTLGNYSPDTTQEDSQSYSNTQTKLPGSKYMQQGVVSATTGSAAGYTG